MLSGLGTDSAALALPVLTTPYRQNMPAKFCIRKRIFQRRCWSRIQFLITHIAPLTTLMDCCRYKISCSRLCSSIHSMNKQIVANSPCCCMNSDTSIPPLSSVTMTYPPMHKLYFPAMIYALQVITQALHHAERRVGVDAVADICDGNATDSGR